MLQFVHGANQVIGSSGALLACGVPPCDLSSKSLLQPATDELPVLESVPKMQGVQYDIGKRGMRKF
jgi:hypothetical protein